MMRSGTPPAYEMHREGRTVPQIAAALNMYPEDVRWEIVQFWKADKEASSKRARRGVIKKQREIE